MKNTFEIEILEDGLIKITSPSSFDGPVHIIAEKALNSIVKELGGNGRRERIKNIHTHNGIIHSHDHEEEVKA